MLDHISDEPITTSIMTFPIRAEVALVHYLSFHILPQRKGSIPGLEKLEMGQGDMSLRI